MNNEIILIDNEDSFVYNLVDTFWTLGLSCTVLRNSVTEEQVADLNPSLICLSPGPGHPLQAGNMMRIIERFYGKTPILGICLGLQALLQYCGGKVEPCGPVHGEKGLAILTEEGKNHPLFEGLIDNPLQTKDQEQTISVARYHSLGCVDMPDGLVSLAQTDTKIGPVCMAAISDDGLSLGMQFHPESVLTPSGPKLLNRSIELLLAEGDK